MQVYAILLLSLVGAVASADVPWFCHKAECPEFKTKEQHSDYEVRQYKPAKWVSIEVEGEGGYEKAYRTGYAKLYSYISGSNDQAAHLDTTAPVRVLMHTAGKGVGFEDKYTISFFLPKRFQDKPPTPNDRFIHIEEAKDMTVYVIAYSGYNTEKTIESKAAILYKLLADKGTDVEQQEFYSLNYDNPLRVIKRHNEIWIMPKKQEDRVDKTVSTAKQYAQDVIRNIG